MKRLIGIVVLLVSYPHLASGQASPDSWDNLKELRPGQKIQVVDSKMKTLNGPFVSVSDESITLQVGKSEQSVARAEVVRVSVRDTSHRTRNMLLGSGIAGGIAIAATVVPLAISANEGGSCGVCVAAIAAGFGGGAALGAIPGSRTIYRAEVPRASAGP
jgi:hypothetical protein